jgi:hypothetical protein
VRGAGIISVGYSAGELLISASAAGAGDGVNILAAGTQTANTTGTVVFSNANGVTFGMSNSSVITASINAAGGGIAAAAGTQTGTSGTVVFSNSNGISFGMSNSSAVTAENRRLSYWEPYQYLTGQNLNNASLYLQPVTVSAKMDATQLQLMFRFSNSASAANTGNISFALYTMAGSTASRASSTSIAYSYNSTLGGSSSATNFNGTRIVTLGLGTWAVTPGEYLAAFWMSTTSALTSGTVSVYGRTANTFNGFINDTNSTSGTVGWFMPGIYTTTTAGMPGSIEVSEIQVKGNSVQRQPWFAMLGTR